MIEGLWSITVRSDLSLLINQVAQIWSEFWSLTLCFFLPFTLLLFFTIRTFLLKLFFSHNFTKVFTTWHLFVYVLIIIYLFILALPYYFYFPPSSYALLFISCHFLYFVIIFSMWLGFDVIYFLLLVIYLYARP